MYIKYLEFLTCMILWNRFLHYFSSNFSSILLSNFFYLTTIFIYTIHSTITFDINYIYACAKQKIQISEFKAYRAKRLFPLIFYNLCLEKYFSLSLKKNKESKYNKIIKERRSTYPFTSIVTCKINTRSK